jgi:beta-xylosidase
MLQRVSSDDGYTKIGEPVELLHSTPADGPDIEAPALVFHPGSGIYFLFYNSECFMSPRYRIEYATSKTLTGPYTRNPTPLLVSGETAAHVDRPGGIDFNANGSLAVFSWRFGSELVHGQGQSPREPNPRHVRSKYHDEWRQRTGP